MDRNARAGAIGSCIIIEAAGGVKGAGGGSGSWRGVGVADEGAIARLALALSFGKGVPHISLKG